METVLMAGITGADRRLNVQILLLATQTNLGCESADRSQSAQAFCRAV
jgi:hypothetical protein